jgi:hypothetical protein
MKRITSFLALTLGFILFFAVVLVAQTDPVLPPPITPNPTGGLDLNVLLDWTNVVYGGIVILVGYISNLIPGLKLITNTAWRVAAIALIVGAAFLIAGKGFLPLLISYTLSTNFYSLFLSLFKKTPPVIETTKVKTANSRPRE